MRKCSAAFPTKEIHEGAIDCEPSCDLYMAPFPRHCVTPVSIYRGKKTQLARREKIVGKNNNEITQQYK